MQNSSHIEISFLIIFQINKTSKFILYFIFLLSSLYKDVSASLMSSSVYKINVYRICVYTLLSMKVSRLRKSRTEVGFYLNGCFINSQKLSGDGRVQKIKNIKS